MTISNYFENVAEESQAYFIGFLLTDGSINVTKYTNYMELTLQARDEQILYVLRNELQANVSILKTKTGARRLIVGNNKLVSDLAKYGVVPRKTFIAAAPVLPKELQRHFWRGAMDGDGTIRFVDRSSSLTFCGAEKLINGFKDFCDPVVNRNYEIYKQRNIYYYRISGKNCYKVLRILYDESTVFLERKKEIYDKINAYFLVKKKSSAFVGVSWNKSKNKYLANCMINGIPIRLGAFKNEIDAALAYDCFVLEHNLIRGINFPERKKRHE